VETSDILFLLGFANKIEGSCCQKNWIQGYTDWRRWGGGGGGRVGLGWGASGRWEGGGGDFYWWAATKETRKVEWIRESQSKVQPQPETPNPNTWRPPIWNRQSHWFKFLYITQLSYTRIFPFCRASSIQILTLAKGLVTLKTYIVTYCDSANNPASWMFRDQNNTYFVPTLNYQLGIYVLHILKSKFQHEFHVESRKIFKTM